MGDAASAAAAASAAFPRAAKTLAAALLCGYALCLLPPVAWVLPLVPGKALPCVWMLLTSSFVELHLLSALAHAAALLLLCRLVEPRWGAAETLRFAAVTAAGAGLLVLAAAFLGYVFTRRGGLLYGRVAGGQALVAGLAVAVKQAHGEAELSLGAGDARLRLRGRHAPAAALAPYCLLALTGGEGVARATHALAGAVAAWWYLRFHQRLVDGAPPGDPSPGFAAASFLPDALASRLLRGGAAQQPQPAQPPPEGAPLPGSAPLDASRRRERGAKALEQRLAMAGAGKRDGAGERRGAQGSVDAASRGSEAADAAV